MTTDVRAHSALPEANESLTEAVYQAIIGWGSVCWSDMSGTGVFDVVKAREAAEDLLMRVKVITGFGDPHLGLATNAQLREEMRAREEMGHTEDDYRTLEPGQALWHLVEEPWVGKESLWQHRDYPHIFSTDRGKTWYNINEPLDFEGNPKIYGTEHTSA
jgi:hypothetical protein